MIKKLIRFGFTVGVIYISVNWAADNPTKINKFRNFMNDSVVEIVK